MQTVEKWNLTCIYNSAKSILDILEELEDQIQEEAQLEDLADVKNLEDLPDNYHNTTSKVPQTLIKRHQIR